MPQDEEREKARVLTFKPNGKYSLGHEWEIPTQEEVLERGGRPGDDTSPYCMRFSKDFSCIPGGFVLVEEQEPWGWPHLIKDPNN